jgi:hypothetical protein
MARAKSAKRKSPRAAKPVDTPATATKPQAAAPGATSDGALRITSDEAQKLMLPTARLVADLPAGSRLEVVWVSGTSELTVDTAGLTFACDPGVVTIGVPVSCDQVASAVVTVSLAIGTAAAPSGLLMSTFTVPQGPAIIVDLWGEAITAFAWEVLLHLTQQLSGQAGVDKSGEPLVPALIAADADLLVIQPMARHNVIGAAT